MLKLLQKSFLGVLDVFICLTTKFRRNLDRRNLTKLYFELRMNIFGNLDFAHARLSIFNTRCEINHAAFSIAVHFDEATIRRRIFSENLKTVRLDLNDRLCFGETRSCDGC